MEYPKADLGTRFLAYLIDALVNVALSMLIFFLAFILGIASVSSKFYLIIVPLLLIVISYSLFKDGMFDGQSIGKRTMGLMVVQLENNDPCDYKTSFVRNFVSFFPSLIPYVGFLIEPMMAIFAKNGQKIGDRAAKTQVISIFDYRELMEEQINLIGDVENEQ